MDFTNIYFPAWFSWTTSSCSLLMVLYVLGRLYPFQQLQARLNQWLWSVFFLGIIWFIRVTLDSGFNMHLSGAMLMALMFGWRLGFLGLCLVNVLVCLFGNALFINLGTAILLNALLPVTLSYFIFLVLEAKLPRHFFIYIFGTAFFGSWIMSITTGIVISLCLTIFDAFAWPLLIKEYLPYHFLLGFAEAFQTAALITLFVVYQPAWVYTFRDQRYLHGK